MFKAGNELLLGLPAENELQEVQEKNGVHRKKESIKETVVHLNHSNDSTAIPADANVTATKEDEGGFDETPRKFLEVFVAEVLGTAFLLCMGCMGGVVGLSPNTLHPAVPGAFFGLLVACLIQMFGHISAAHLNPCVSVCFYLLGEISLPMLGNYFVAEALGSIIGFGLLKVLTPVAVLEEQPTLCCTIVHEELNTFQALGIEFISTSILVLLVCACTDTVNAAKQDSVPIKFGLYIAFISVVAGPYTGASINPTRTLAPALWNGYWENQWIYWAAPLSASVVVTILYQMFFWKGEKSMAMKMRKNSKKFIFTKAK